MCWDNERGANIVMEGDKVLESYLLGTFGDPDLKGKICDIVLFSYLELMLWIE